MISNLMGGLAIFFAFAWSFDVNDWLRSRGLVRPVSIVLAAVFFAGSVAVIAGVSDWLLHQECADSHAPDACEADARGEP